MCILLSFSKNWLIKIFAPKYFIVSNFWRAMNNFLTFHFFFFFCSNQGHIKTILCRNGALNRFLFVWAMGCCDARPIAFKTNKTPIKTVKRGIITPPVITPHSHPPPPFQKVKIIAIILFIESFGLVFSTNMPYLLTDC